MPIEINTTAILMFFVGVLVAVVVLVLVRRRTRHRPPLFAAAVFLVAGTIGALVIPVFPSCPSGYRVEVSRSPIPPFESSPYCASQGVSGTRVWPSGPKPGHDYRIPVRIAIFGLGLALAGALAVVAFRTSPES